MKKYAYKKLVEYTDKEIVNKYSDLWNKIFKENNYRTNDLTRLDKLEIELEKRGFLVDVENNVIVADEELSLTVGFKILQLTI